MKILVFGHSDSDGSHLPDPQDAWPWVLQRLLAAHEVEAEIVHRLLFAGPSAPSFVARQVARETPDVAIVATSTFGVLVKMVSKRVRQRFGEPAGRAAARAERFVADHPGPAGSARANALLRVRRVGRAVFGAAGDSSYAELVACYEACFRELAQREQTHSIIVGGAAYTQAVWRLNPGSELLQARSNVDLKAAASEHRFDWISHEELLGGPANKLPFYQDDGVHTDKESNRLVAEALLPLVLARL